MERLNKSKLVTAVVGILFLGMLAGCGVVETSTDFAMESSTRSESENSELEFSGAIIPHHLLVGKQMEDFYAELSDESIERIILLSPNHFNHGFHYIQTTDQAFSTVEKAPELDLQFINTLIEASSLESEPIYFEKEHGVTTHLEFIVRHFPNAKIVPVTIKGGTPQIPLDNLLEGLQSQDLSNTLFISSIDFSHYEIEEIALANDERTQQWLTDWSEEEPEDSYGDIKTIAKNLDEDNEDAVAMDSPESLYIITKMMSYQGAKEITFWKRTSTTSLVGIQDPLQNTSHLFINFR